MRVDQDQLRAWLFEHPGVRTASLRLLDPVPALKLPTPALRLPDVTRSPGLRLPGVPGETRPTPGRQILFRASEPAAMRFRENGVGTAILEGRLMPYGQWAEINSSREGHFLERFAPGSLAGAMSKSASKIRVLFEHGLDMVLGKQSIAALEEVRDQADGAYYRATLLNGVPPLLMEGLRKGLYGSSVRFHSLKADKVRSPRRSSNNPDGLPEHTIRAAKIYEFSVVSFPAYEGATAQVVD